MAFIPTPNGIEVDITYTANSKELHNIITIDSGEPVSDANVSEAASVVAGWAQTEMVAILGEDAEIISVESKGMDAVETFTAIVTSGFPAAGDVVGALLPTNVAACVSLRTGLTGRSSRGRLYFGGLTEGQVQENNFTPTAVTAIQAVYNELRTILLTAFPLGGWAVTSFISEGVARAEGRQLLITTVQVDTRVDTQRRRL